MASCGAAKRRLRSLRRHLTAAPERINVRPTDEGKSEEVDTSPYIQGLWEPVETEQHAVLSEGTRVEGVIPKEICGIFLRIGPNPQFSFRGKPYHVFDGDGMIHSVSFPGGGQVPLYRNSWVRTRRLAKDRSAGYSYSLIGEFEHLGPHGSQDISFVFDSMERSSDGSFQYLGPANTAIVWHKPSKSLLALNEGDKPYAVKLPSLETEGRVESFGNVPLGHNFTAHPKRCPLSGDLVFFGYNTQSRKGPWLHYGGVDASGNLRRSFPVTLPHPVMMHDMVITPQFSLLFDSNHRWQGLEHLLNHGGAPYKHHPEIPARFGILPRYAQSDAEIQWVEVLGCIVFHFANAWVEESNADIISVVGCRMETLHLDELGESRTQEQNAQQQGRFYLWRLDISKGKCVEERQLASDFVDFPQINPHRNGQHCRFFYGARFVGAFDIDATIKLDLETGLVSAYEHGGCGGEACFVRREGGTSEDDGWLILFTHIPIHGRNSKGGALRSGSYSSCLEIINARSMDRVARIHLPCRVPAGFHAYWLDDKEQE